MVSPECTREPRSTERRSIKPVTLGQISTTSYGVSCAGSASFVSRVFDLTAVTFTVGACVACGFPSLSSPQPNTRRTRTQRMDIFISLPPVFSRTGYLDLQDRATQIQAMLSLALSQILSAGQAM